MARGREKRVKLIEVRPKNYDDANRRSSFKRNTTDGSLDTRIKKVSNASLPGNAEKIRTANKEDVLDMENFSAAKVDTEKSFKADTNADKSKEGCKTHIERVLEGIGDEDGIIASMLQEIIAAEHEMNAANNHMHTIDMHMDLAAYRIAALGYKMDAPNKIGSTANNKMGAANIKMDLAAYRIAALGYKMDVAANKIDSTVNKMGPAKIKMGVAAYRMGATVCKLDPVNKICSTANDKMGPAKIKMGVAAYRMGATGCKMDAPNDKTDVAVKFIKNMAASSVIGDHIVETDAKKKKKTKKKKKKKTEKNKDKVVVEQKAKPTQKRSKKKQKRKSEDTSSTKKEAKVNLNESKEEIQLADPDATANKNTERKWPCIFGFISSWLAKRKERRRAKKRKAIETRQSASPANTLVEYEHKQAKGGVAFTLELDNRPMRLPVLPPIKPRQQQNGVATDDKVTKADKKRSEALEKKKKSAKDHDKRKAKCQERKEKSEYDFKQKAELTVLHKQGVAEQNRIQIQENRCCGTPRLRAPSTLPPLRVIRVKPHADSEDNGTRTVGILGDPEF